MRRRIPPLNDRQVSRLPAQLRYAHHAWLAAEGTEARFAQQDYRARLVAASLHQAGDDAEEIERQLVVLGYAGSGCRQRLERTTGSGRRRPVSVEQLHEGTNAVRRGPL